MLEVYPIGLLVDFIHAEDIRGKVTALMVEENNHVSYKVAWWNSRARVCEWVAAEELKPASSERSRIGFNGFESSGTEHTLRNVSAARKCIEINPGHSKGGLNPSNLSSERPPAPGAGGNKPDLDMPPRLEPALP